MGGLQLILVLVIAVALWILYHKVFHVVYFNAIQGLFREAVICIIIAGIIVFGISGKIGDTLHPKEDPPDFLGTFYNLAYFDGNGFETTLTIQENEEDENELSVSGFAVQTNDTYAQNFDIRIPIPDGNTFTCYDEWHDSTLTISFNPDEQTLDVVQETTDPDTPTPYTGKYSNHDVWKNLLDEYRANQIILDLNGRTIAYGKEFSNGYAEIAFTNDPSLVDASVLYSDPEQHYEEYYCRIVFYFPDGSVSILHDGFATVDQGTVIINNHYGSSGNVYTFTWPTNDIDSMHVAQKYNDQYEIAGDYKPVEPTAYAERDSVEFTDDIGDSISNDSISSTESVYTPIWNPMIPDTVEPYMLYHGGACVATDFEYAELAFFEAASDALNDYDIYFYCYNYTDHYDREFVYTISGTTETLTEDSEWLFTTDDDGSVYHIESTDLGVITVTMVGGAVSSDLSGTYTW